MSVHWPILKRQLSRPLRVSIIDDRGTWRGIKLVAGAMHLANRLEATCQSNTVGVMLPSSGAFPMAALAGWMVGKVVVPLNFLLKPSELQYVVDDCETDTIVTAGALLEHMGGAPRVGTLIDLEREQFKGLPRPRRPATARDDDLAVLLYTSGTSGRPKGVMLTHGNLAANVEQCRRWVNFTSRERLMGVLPQFHSFGLTVLTLLPLTLGCTVVYSARFVPQRIVRLIKEHRPTALIAIPSMYGALLQVKGATREDLESLRFVVSGGEPLPQAIFDQFRERFGITINEGYGLTETAPVTNWCRPMEWRPHSVGMALPEVDQRIVDPETGEPLPRNAEGEIVMKGPNVMRGYYKLDDETKAAFDRHGYFRTGDMGKLDDDGFLYITGRIKEMLIVGGENVFPREIEEVLNQHPAVAASGVIGVTDPVRGELPVAFVELTEGQPADERTLIHWCRERLAAYKTPRAVHIVPALPRNPVGKIVRRELRSLLPAESTDPA